ncbi:MAG: histone deacetylase [Candidatus Nanoarchaeia archaeon]|nr:histone deacetylase [Candidatus Nanoarchaeia archaeon]
MATALVSFEEHNLHNEPSHSENAERVNAILKAIGSSKLPLLHLKARKAAKEEIIKVHSNEFYDYLSKPAFEVIGALTRFNDELYSGDTYFTDRTFEAALFSAGSVLTAIDAVKEGRAKNAFALSRPPGHHAEKEEAKGFCFFNNIAIAARYAQGKGFSKVFILDFDVHHGNGTQHIFYEDNSVFYCSTHQWPLYPGTGKADETGEGKGRGFTLNIPLKAGTTSERYLELMKEKIIPAIDSFKPDILLISAGFDAHKDDPLGDLELDAECYGRMAEMLKASAEKYCNGRIIFSLEGGYNVKALADSALEVLKSLSA